MGLLDILSGNLAAASPWGALYQSPTADPFDQVSQALIAAQTGQAPPPFGDPSKFSVAAPLAPPAPGNFGAGAAPFSFAGPGSNVPPPPASLAPAPAPAPAPAMPPVAARPAPAVPTPGAPGGAPAAPAASAAAPGPDG